ncbi:hypothetical protein ACIQK6_33735 [Streptomyces sp. NPDC091682]|uniref:hypothetical protein n=1 Tax=Streptomyces sp. NPDC091682 TaxID=3366005 RepID=UPI003800083C
MRDAEQAARPGVVEATATEEENRQLRARVQELEFELGIIRPSRRACSTPPSRRTCQWRPALGGEVSGSAVEQVTSGKALSGLRSASA